LHTKLLAQLPDTKPHRLQLLENARRFSDRTATQIAQRRHALASLSSQLALLNPQRTLERGYAIIADARGAIVRHPGQIKIGQQLDITMAEGAAQIGVKSVQEKLSDL